MKKRVADETAFVLNENDGDRMKIVMLVTVKFNIRVKQKNDNRYCYDDSKEDDSIMIMTIVSEHKKSLIRYLNIAGSGLR